jgi:hypothetical protein
MTYKTAPGTLWNQQIGYGAGCSRARIVNNSFVGTTLLTNCTSDLALNGNTFYGRVRFAWEPRARWLYKILRRVQRWTESIDIPEQGSAAAAAAFPENNFNFGRPKGVRIIVRPNRFEMGRANIAVYNWDRKGFIDLDLGRIVPRGSLYEVRNAQDYFGAPVVAAVYNGGRVRIPLSGLSVASPNGILPPLPTGPDFNAFVVVTLAPQ